MKAHRDGDEGATGARAVSRRVAAAGISERELSKQATFAAAVFVAPYPAMGTERGQPSIDEMLGSANDTKGCKKKRGRTSR